MNDESRTVNSVRNSIAGVLVQGSSVILSFATRVVFVKCLNEEYLGVNGLFSNILTVLSLAELGVGTAIIYSLYKPVADKDEVQISALLNFYRKAYLIIGCLITVLGLLITPFISIFVKEVPDIPNLIAIYLMFLGNTTCSYFFAYKRSIFTADQREHLLSKYKLCFTVMKALGQCTILVATHNFILYLAVQIVCSLGENLLVCCMANKYYPFLKKYKFAKLQKEKVSKIVTNVKALMIYKVGSTALDGTDNIILSIFVGVVWVGKLSNYTLIVNAINMIAAQVINAITASVGNFIAKEDSSRYEDLLYRITFISFLIYGFSFVCLTCLMTPFIQLTFGEPYVLSFPVVLILALNFYIFGMMGSVWTFRTTMGLFVYGKYRPLISAVINIIVSIVLAQFIGLLGVLLGTTITRVVTNVWYDPYIVYKYGIKKSPLIYYAKWVRYLMVSLTTVVIIEVTFKCLPELNIFIFILECFICVGVFCLTLALTMSEQSEFNYIKDIVLQRINSKHELK